MKDKVTPSFSLFKEFGLTSSSSFLFGLFHTISVISEPKIAPFPTTDTVVKGNLTPELPLY